MVDITEDEYKEYIRLKEKEERRQRFLKKKQEEILPNIQETVKSASNARSFAAVYAKRLQKYYEKFKRNVFTLRWTEEKRYLTDKLLRIDEQGRANIKRHFRGLMAEYGWRFRIYHKYGVLEVRRVHPK